MPRHAFPPPPIRQAGFSFIELVATLAILATLAAVALPLAETTVRRHKEQELRRALRDIRQALDAYKRAADDGRIALSPERSGYPARLEELVQGVPNAKQAGGTLRFLRRLPPDPFAADPMMPPAQSWATRSYDSPADAPHEGADVFDVYSRSEQIGLNGLPYREW
ncbi:type II secretion system protein [Chitinimonas koreensis]|uniref:type II secretion system protein n=1 Tax=Chitinimonas koreensis TaxID=356302 RepID=UPI0004177522|nr:type II secretion system protein [Chitinimonas koreensis]